MGVGGLPVVVYVYEYLIVTVDQSWTLLSSVLYTNAVIVVMCTHPLSAVNGMGISLCGTSEAVVVGAALELWCRCLL